MPNCGLWFEPWFTSNYCIWMSAFLGDRNGSGTAQVQLRGPVLDEPSVNHAACALIGLLTLSPYRRHRPPLPFLFLPPLPPSPLLDISHITTRQQEVTLLNCHDPPVCSHRMPASSSSRTTRATLYLRDCTMTLLYDQGSARRPSWRRLIRRWPGSKSAIIIGKTELR